MPKFACPKSRCSASPGTSAIIVMPSDSPALKIANTRAYGAEVVLYDRDKESREEIEVGLESMANKYGWKYVMDTVARMAKKE